MQERVLMIAVEGLATIQSEKYLERKDYLIFKI